MKENVNMGNIPNKSSITVHNKSSAKFRKPLT